MGLPLARQRLAYQKAQETYGGDDADLDDRVDWDVKAAQGGQSGTRDVEFMRAMAAERAREAAEGQAGRGFWGSLGHDLEDVAAAGAVVGLGVMTGGLADAAIGGTKGQ